MLNNISHRLPPYRGVVNFIWAQLYTVVNNLLVNLPMIFPRFSGSLGCMDQSLGKQRQNGLEDLLAAGLCPQNAPSLFHFAPFLSIAVSTALEEMAFHLFPGWTTPSRDKQI